MIFSDIRPGESVKDVHFTEDTLSVDLNDGRTITVPLAWYPRLLYAKPDQRRNWQVSGGGFGIHWPDIDEDLSTEGLLRGAPAPRKTMSHNLIFVPPIRDLISSPTTNQPIKRNAKFQPPLFFSLMRVKFSSCGDYYDVSNL